MGSLTARGTRRVALTEDRFVTGDALQKGYSFSL
jgi:hypothetical protein